MKKCSWLPVPRCWIDSGDSACGSQQQSAVQMCGSVKLCSVVWCALCRRGGWDDWPMSHVDPVRRPACWDSRCALRVATPRRPSATHHRRTHLSATTPSSISPPALAQPNVSLCNAALSFFNDFCQTSYLNIYRTDLQQICRIGRTIAVDERYQVCFSIRGNQFLGAKSRPKQHSCGSCDVC